MIIEDGVMKSYCSCCGEATEKTVDGGEFGYDDVCPECMRGLEGTEDDH